VNKNAYDILIAGSGIGGLCAAALLAHHGYKVLLTEKLERLGGRFSTIEQEGFKTPTGAAVIASRGVFKQTYKEVSTPFNLREGGPTIVWLFGEWHMLPEKGQIRALLSLLDKIGADKAKIMGHMAKAVATEKILGAFKRGVTKLDPLSNMSFRDWLKQYTDDERVLKLFHSLTSAISTVNDFEYPASHWFTYVSSAGQGGLAFHGVSVRGNEENANALAAAVRARGGDVWINSPVKKIVILKGKVTSVLIEREGKEIEVEAQMLVSNMGPGRTMELAGRDSFPPDYVKQVDDLRSSPIVATLIASSRPLVDVTGSILIAGASRIVAGAPLTNYSAELAPHGQHLSVFWGTPLSCLHKVNREEEAKANWEDLEQIFPNFDSYARVLRQDVFDIDDEFPATRAWMGYDMPQDTPIPNLFHVGDAVKPFGWEGVEACAKGAHLVVNEIRKCIKPKVQ